MSTDTVPTSLSHRRANPRIAQLEEEVAEVQTGTLDLGDLDEPTLRLFVHVLHATQCWGPLAAISAELARRGG